MSSMTSSAKVPGPVATSDTPTNIAAAKKFTVALVSNVKLLNAFLAAERKIIQIDPQFETASLDNFLVQNHYDCTIAQVVKYGKPILSELAHWKGTYVTKTSSPGSTTWTDGPTITVGADGAVSVNGAAEHGAGFEFLNLTWPGCSLMFYMAKDPEHPGQRIPALFGTFSGFRLVGLSKPAEKSTTSGSDESTFMRVVGVVGKYLGQINQAFQMYELIHKAVGLQAKANDGDMDAEAELGRTRLDLSSDITDVSTSQGEIATVQQSAIEERIAQDPGMSSDDASDALRDAQADELDLEQVEDVDAAQLDPGGETIIEPGAADGGLEIGAEAGEEAVGELTVDMFLEDALMLILL